MRKLIWVMLSVIGSGPVWPLLAQTAGEEEPQANSPADRAEHEEHPTHTIELEHLTVRANPLGRSALESTQPISVLAGEKLDDRRAATIGETLQFEPGIHSTAFGPGASRPVIRGLGGSRVRILEDGIGTLDASALSDDHAVAVEPLLVDQIEVLKGPATLLYGSAASAGVVNVIDGRVPETAAQEPVSGRLELRGNTVADERAAVARLDGGRGMIAWHADGFFRDTDNLEIPGFALSKALQANLAPAELAELERGRLGNSDVETSGGTGGLSVVGDWGYLGAAFQRLDTNYGIPADLEAESGEDDLISAEEDAEERPDIDLRRNKWSVRGGLFEPVNAIERFTFKLGTSNYRHDELEGEEIATRFDIDANEWRLEAVHAEFGGLQGVFGVQGFNEDLVVTGTEAFLPDSKTETIGGFVVEQLRLGDWRLDASARYESAEISNREGGQSREFQNVSTGLGVLWNITGGWQTSINWTRSERSPTQEELFADGAHLAIQTFELGDDTLTEETANNIDFSIHKHAGAVHARVNFFYNKVDDFVFLADTGTREEGLPVRIWSQEDADFIGAEAQLGWHMNMAAGTFDVNLTFDTVDGERDSGPELPRISPTRYGMEVDWHYGGWRAGLTYHRVNGVEDAGPFETTTPDYNMLNAVLSYRFMIDATEWELFLKGDNLIDETARVHTSFLKDHVPLPGINLAFGLRGNF